MALLRWGCSVAICGFFSASVLTVWIVPSLMKNVAIHTGITKATKLGIKRFTIRLAVVTLSAIHSMMVVTSPIGEKAPPLLAAITITLAKSHLSFLSLSKRRSIITMIMVVVMLSSTALMKNAKMLSVHIRCFLFLALICSVIKLKPP